MKITPSNLGRAMACSGSPRIESKYPDTRRKEAGEGILAHHAGAAILCGRDPKTLDHIGADMLPHVMGYVSHCLGLGPGEGHVEKKYHGYWFNGIVDFWTFHQQLETLFIRDLKYGHGWVSPLENWQLLAYAMLVVGDGATAVKWIDLGVYQPRGHHPEGPARNWVISIDELRIYQTKMNEHLQNIFIGGPTQVVSGGHCKNCRGLVACHGAKAAASYALDVAMEAGYEDPTPDQLAEELELLGLALRILKNKRAAVEQHTVEALRLGAMVPGWNVEQSVSNAMWRQSTDRIVSAGDMMGVNLRQPLQAITPTQALGRKMITAEQFKRLSTRKTGGWKLKKINQNKIKELLK